VPCPWCGGGGVRLDSVDAQARWRAAQERPDAGEEGGSSGEDPPDAAA
jgi:hypothetical protein